MVSTPAKAIGPGLLGKDGLLPPPRIRGLQMSTDRAGPEKPAGLGQRSHERRRRWAL